MRLLITAVLVAFCSSASPLCAQSAEDTARRTLILACEGRFADAPRTADAATRTFERLIRNLLRVRCLRAEAIAVRDADVHADRAVITVDLALDKSDRITNAPVGSEIVPLRVELVRNDGIWLVSAIALIDDELADRLLSVSSAERDMLRDQHAEQLSGRLARTVYQRAMTRLNSGKFKEAEVAAELARSIAIDAGDRGAEALALGALMYVRLMGGNRVEASRLSRESLALAEPLSDPDVLARAWYNHARSLPLDGAVETLHREAVESTQKALQFAERGEDPTILARILGSLAIHATNASDYLTARRHNDQALAIARETGDSLGEMAAEAALASIYEEQGDGERFHFHQSRALALAEKTGAFAYSTLLVRSAYRLRKEGRIDEARALLNKVLTRDERGLVKATRPIAGGELTTALNTLAAIEAETGRMDEAECLARQAGAHLGSREERYLVQIAPYRLQRRDVRGALRWALASLTEPGMLDDERVVALITTARAYRQLNESERGLATILEAIQQLEDFDTRIAGDEKQRAQAAETISDSYELAAEFALDRGDTVQALTFLERGRARVLTDLVENGRPRAMSELDAALAEEQLRLEREMARLRVELDQASAAGRRRAAEHLGAQLQQARATHASFVDGIRARSQLRRPASRPLDSSTVADLARRLPPRTAAVAYFLTDQHLHVFIARPDASVVCRTKQVPRELVEKRVGRFVEMLAAGDLRVDAEARRLHELLIEPIAREIDGATGLVIIPDEILWRVPFAALAGRDGRFLVERSAIAYAPSITAYAAIVDWGRKRNPGAVSLFAVGNPRLDERAALNAKSFYRDATLDPLPEAEAEVDAVQALYDRERTVVLKREAGTEARTKSAIGGATVVHLATHALLDDANPMYSRLALARNESGPEDGWLESWEVARLDLNADVVVLSACETARGSIGGGEGVIGMAWSFFLAGARAIVATQWKIASDSTADLMIDFHRGLLAKRGQPSLQKAEALRQAQLRFIRDPRRRHPFHWAAFVLLGDPSVD